VNAIEWAPALVGVVVGICIGIVLITVWLQEPRR
jgi:uncharacterized membrane-anchored protein YhcB (DUF1043 family)